MEYEEIKQLKQSEKSTVQLVREKDGERVYVRKMLKGYQPIYLLLQICTHPGLPKLYDVTMSDNVTTVIEEYIEGQSLGSAKLSEKQFLNAVRELCSVLEFLHGKGIIHRDIKPSNIILATDGHIRLIDFDAARMPKEDYNQDTRLLGTRGYAPPEQYGFEQTDARADIYALGITLKQLLKDEIQNPYYKRIIQKCTKLDPDKRYQSVRQVRKAFFCGKQRALCGVAVIVLIVFLWGYLQNNIITSQPIPETEDTAVSESIPETEDTAASESIPETEDTAASEPVSETEDIAASKRYPNQVLWNNIPVNDYFGQYIEDIMEEMGTPLEQYTDEAGYGWCSYMGILFFFDEQHKVYRLGLAAEECTYNGAALDASWEKLPEILGEPNLSGQEEASGKYYMTYFEYSYGGKRNYTFYFTSTDEAAFEIWVRKVG